MSRFQDGYSQVLHAAGLKQADTLNPNLGLWNKKPTGGTGLQSNARANPVRPKAPAPGVKAAGVGAGVTGLGAGGMYAKHKYDEANQPWYEKLVE